MARTTEEYMSEKIELRITPREKLIIAAEAQRRGVSNSQLVREAALRLAKK
jgi:uncharacterized protein (DUF1778 family)